MRLSSDDSHIRELVQSLKQVDEQTAPGFEDLLGRPTPKPKRRPARRLQVALLCCAATLLVALFVVRSQMIDDHGRETPNIAQNDGGNRPSDSNSDEGVVEINFEQLHVAVDDYFRDLEADTIDAPDWPTPTDSLLVLNLDIPPTEE